MSGTISVPNKLVSFSPKAAKLALELVPLEGRKEGRKERRKERI